MSDQSFVFTGFFVGALVVGVLLQFWLNSLQIRHVSIHRAQVPAPFSQTISLDAHQKAADYTLAKARIGLVELVINTIVLLGWTLVGGVSAMNVALVHWLGHGMAQQLALLVSFVAIAGMIDLPMSWYQTFMLEGQFGFNKTTPKLWLIDMVKTSLIGLSIGLPIAALILWMMASSGSLWWLWAWLFWISLNLMMLVVYPTLIAPLFNKFSPLDDDKMIASVTALMQRCGFSAKGLFVMDGSKRSAHANAYFTGFGNSKRVVFYDTLLSKLSAVEVDAVLAHELGHFKHRHVVKRIISMFALSLCGFMLLGYLTQQTWFYHGLGVELNLMHANDALALLLFMLVLPVFGVFVGPTLAQISRRHEFQADAYAVQQTSGKDLATALLKLYEDNASTLTPDPLYVRFYYSHPAASERLSRLRATI
jgi:STE24 endopeptidase